LATTWTTTSANVCGSDYTTIRPPTLSHTLQQLRLPPILRPALITQHTLYRASMSLPRSATRVVLRSLHQSLSPFPAPGVILTLQVWHLPLQLLFSLWRLSRCAMAMTAKTRAMTKVRPQVFPRFTKPTPSRSANILRRHPKVHIVSHLPSPRTMRSSQARALRCMPGLCTHPLQTNSHTHPLDMDTLRATP
jgi:hypothetical protein